MAESKIELRQIRDFGANLSDTFEFIRQNFKPMVISFFAISGIFILIQAVSSGVFESGVFSSLDHLSTMPDGSGVFIGRYPFSRYLTPFFFVYMIFIWLAYVAMQVCIGAYMKYYEEHDGAKAGIEDVWQIFVQYFFKVLLYSIPVSVLTMIGCLFCLLPGIYLAVVFVPFPWVVMIEDTSLGDGVQRCFEIIKGYFWVSLGIYIITYLIFSFASAVIGVIIGAVSGLLTYLTTKDMGDTIGIVTSVLRVFSFLFYIIFLVSAMLNYFSLVEHHDATGMLRRIDQIGEQPGDDREISEEY